MPNPRSQSRDKREADASHRKRVIREMGAAMRKVFTAHKRINVRAAGARASTGARGTAAPKRRGPPITRVTQRKGTSGTRIRRIRVNFR
jgi:hypothetical protein